MNRSSTATALKTTILRLAMAAVTATILFGLSMQLVSAIAITADDTSGTAVPVPYVLLFGALCIVSGGTSWAFACWALNSPDRVEGEQNPRIPHPRRPR